MVHALARELVAGRSRRPRLPARQRASEGARLEQLGRRRHADRHGQAAAGQRSAPQRAAALDVVPGARDGRRLRDDRRDAARHAGGGARAQPLHRLGRDQRRGRRRGSLSREARRVRDARRVPRRAGADHRHPGNHRRQGRAPRSASRCASRATARSCPTRSTRTTRRRAGAEAGAARAARLPLDGARRRRLDGGGVPEAERGAQLDAVHRRAARLRLAVAELRLRRRRRPHRLLRARGEFRCARRATDRGPPTAGPATPSGPAGSRSRSCRTSTIRPSTSSSPPTTGRRRPAYPHLLGLEWPEPYRAQRITDLIRGARATS